MIPAVYRNRKASKTHVVWLHSGWEWGQGSAAVPLSHLSSAKNQVTEVLVTSCWHTYAHTHTNSCLSLSTETLHAVYWGQPHVQEHRLWGVWIPLPHNHGPVCAGDYRNVQRTEQVSPPLLWCWGKHSLNVKKLRYLIKTIVKELYSHVRENSIVPMPEKQIHQKHQLFSLLKDLMLLVIMAIYFRFCIWWMWQRSQA